MPGGLNKGEDLGTLPPPGPLWASRPRGPLAPQGAPSWVRGLRGPHEDPGAAGGLLGARLGWGGFCFPPASPQALQDAAVVLRLVSGFFLGCALEKGWDLGGGGLKGFFSGAVGEPGHLCGICSSGGHSGIGFLEVGAPLD